MTEMVCIVCPRGCRLSVGAGPGFTVTGNACERGAAYGRSEAESPERTVTATCPHDGLPNDFRETPRRVPVRTAGAVPKGRVLELAAFLHSYRVKLPVRSGDVIIDDWEGTAVAVVATRDIG